MPIPVRSRRAARPAPAPDRRRVGRSARAAPVGEAAPAGDRRGRGRGRGGPAPASAWRSEERADRAAAGAGVAAHVLDVAEDAIRQRSQGVDRARHDAPRERRTGSRPAEATSAWGRGNSRTAPCARVRAADRPEGRRAAPSERAEELGELGELARGAPDVGVGPGARWPGERFRLGEQAPTERI